MEAAMSMSDSMSFSPETLAQMIEEVFPDIEAQGTYNFDDLGRCPDCGADLFTEGCPSCRMPRDY